MRRLHRFRPSPAMFVASLALLVGLAGTSVAAVNALPHSSVGTFQLKNNAVVSSKVKGHSLLRSDFANGQLPRGPQGPQGPQGPAGPAGPAGAAGVATPGYVAQVTSDTSTSAVTSNSTSFTDLPDANEAITVPTGQTARIYVFFTAESACYGGTGNQFCGVRVTVDGNEIAPASANDFAFDSTDQNKETSASWESHAIARVSGTLAAGSHTVKVQGRTSSASTNLRLDDWAMVVQVVRVT